MRCARVQRGVTGSIRGELIKRRYVVAKGSEKARYLSGSLSKQETLRQLSTKAPISDDLAEPLSEDDFVINIVDDDDDDEEEEEEEEEIDLVDFDEGWSAEIVDDLFKVEEAMEEEEDFVDLRSDPMFGSLPEKSIQELENHLKQETENKQKEYEDESSPSTRTTKKPHRQLRIIGGTLKGHMLLSPRGKFVRPMMERVRSAIFNMLFATGQGDVTLPPGSRWLDLYAGTGAVGLEAMSRGCEEVHFVEMDPWIASCVLRKNIEECEVQHKSVVRTTKVEDFLDRLMKVPQYSSGPFDFVSVCPPYRQVSYPDLQKQLEVSGILHDSSLVFMEYPRQLKRQILDSIGNLRKIKDRRYGRTYLAVYGRDVSDD